MNSASVPVSTLGLVKTVIGLGTMTMPFAFAQGGVLIALFSLFGIVVWAQLMFRLLGRCSNLSSEYTFISLARQAFGKSGFSKILASLAEITVLLYASGSCIAYIRCFGDFLPPLISLFHPPDWVADPRLSIVVVSTLIFPFTCMRNINALRWVSFLAMTALGFCTIVVIVEFSLRGLWIPPEETSSSWWLIMPDAWKTLLTAFPLFAVSNTGHHNFLRIYGELSEKGRVGTVVVSTSLICMFLYSTMGLFGFLTFGADTPPNILNAYPTVFPASPAATVDIVRFVSVSFARGLLVFAIALSLPSPFYAVRTGVENVIVGCLAKPPALTPRWRLILEALVSMAVFVGLAIILPEITTVFSISGSLFGPIIVYLLPPLFYLFLTRKPRLLEGEPLLADTDDTINDGGESAEKSRRPASLCTPLRTLCIICLCFGSLFAVLSLAQAIENVL